MKKFLKKSISAALCAAVVCSGQTMVPRAEEEKTSRIDEIIAGMTVQEKVGQMIMTAFRSWNENPEDENSESVPVTELRPEIRKAIAEDRYGGIIVFSENCGENEQTIRLISQMQEANQDTDCANPVPLLIAADQEGGAVARLGQGIRGIGNMAVAATGDPQNAEEEAACMGEELAALWINTDFAPVLDVNNNPANPVIGVRSFSDDPETAAEYGVRFMKGLQASGTISSLKHFPGHGDVATDSHTGFPILEKTYEELKECELIPFRRAIEEGADMVMTAHIQYPKIESGTYTSISTGEEVYLPATLSHTILTDILRDDMGFDGVVVSDALEMAAIADNFERNDVAVMAIEAGIDLFLIPVTVTDAASLAELEDFIAYICEQVENGTIAESRIEESVRRILTLKEKYGLLEPLDTNLTEEQLEAARDIPGSQEHHDREWEMMQKAVTLLKNDQDTVPVTVQPGKKVLFLYSAASRIATAEFARLRLVEEGILPEDVSFEAVVCDQENRPDCIKAVEEADHVILVSTMFGAGEMDPATEGSCAGIFDEVIETAHAQGKKAILVSSYLPYDTARYSEADAILVTWGSLYMQELPKEKEAYSVNIPAAICSIFGEFECTGSTPVNIPKVENYTFTEEILYPRA